MRCQVGEVRGATGDTRRVIRLRTLSSINGEGTMTRGQLRHDAQAVAGVLTCIGVSSTG